MSGVVVRMKTNQIAVQQATQDFIADRQYTIQLGAGEGRMQEKADLDRLVAAHFISQHFWEQHQMVVMDPDEIAVLHVSCDCLGEFPINSFIGLPAVFGEGNLSRVVVKKWPQDSV